MFMYSWLGFLLEYPDEFRADLEKFIADHAAALDANPDLKRGLQVVMEAIGFLTAAIPKEPALHSELIAQPVPAFLRTGATNKLIGEILGLLKGDAKVSEVLDLVEQLVGFAGSATPEETEPSKEPVGLELLGETYEKIKQATKELVEAAQNQPPPIAAEIVPAVPATDSREVVQEVLRLTLGAPLEVLFTQAFEHWDEIFMEHLHINRWVDWEYTAAAEHQISQFDLLQALLPKKDRKRLSKLVVQIQEAIGELRRRKMVHRQLNTPPAGPRPQGPSQSRPGITDHPPHPVPSAPAPVPAPAAVTETEGEPPAKPRRGSRHGQAKKEGNGQGEIGDDGPPVKKGRPRSAPPPAGVGADEDEEGDEDHTIGAAFRAKNGDVSALGKVAEAWAQSPGLVSAPPADPTLAPGAPDHEADPGDVPPE